MKNDLCEHSPVSLELEFSSLLTNRNQHMNETFKTHLRLISQLRVIKIAIKYQQHFAKQTLPKVK